MSLAKIAEVAREREVDLIIVAGDLFDAPIRNSDADSMPKLLDACGALLDAAPVVSVQGTPSHDAPGCYAPIWRGHEGWYHFDRWNAGQAIILPNDAAPLNPDVGYWWTRRLERRRSMRDQSHHHGVAGAVARLAERGRQCAGRADAGEAVVDGLRSILAGIGAATHGRTVPHHPCPARRGEGRDAGERAGATARRASRSGLRIWP